MNKNKSEFQKNIIGDLFTPTTNDNNIFFSPKVEENSQTLTDDVCKKRTYNIPVKILDNIEKIVYMDRDLKSNTDFLIKALESYLDSENCKKLLEEYNLIKGEKK